MKMLVLMGMALLLCACGKAPTAAESDIIKKINEGDVSLATTAPDGTKLWVVRSFGRLVYFSTSGTQTVENCGKNCTRDIDVPAVSK